MALNFQILDSNKNRNINKLSDGIALKLRRICDSYEKYQKRSNEYQNYLIAKSYSPILAANNLKKYLKFLVIMHENPAAKF